MDLERGIMKRPEYNLSYHFKRYEMNRKPPKKFILAVYIIMLIEVGKNSTNQLPAIKGFSHF